MDSVFVPNPVLVDALAASIHSAGVAAMWISAVFLLGGFALLVLAIKVIEDEEECAAAGVVGVVFVLISAIIFATHLDDVSSPRYEALKQITNRHYQGLNAGSMLP